MVHSAQHAVLPSHPMMLLEGLMHSARQLTVRGIGWHFVGPPAWLTARLRGVGLRYVVQTLVAGGPIPPFAGIRTQVLSVCFRGGVLILKVTPACSRLWHLAL